MAARAGVLIIHGMGDPEPSYAEGLIRRVRERLGPSADDAAFEACYWAPILQPKQDVTWQRMLRSGRMDLKAARRWIMSALGDPATYLSGFFRAGRPAYADIHACVRSTLARLSDALGGRQDAPLVVLAHSLGSVIVSNYIWDEQQGAPEIGRTPFERMETLTGLVTYGSTIPLFLPPGRPAVCIRFPPPMLPPPLAAAAVWKNIYDPDDVLGYPLADIWDDPQGTRIVDVDINVGLWPASETPFSHTFYDRDGDFLEHVVELVSAVLAIAPQE
jgi:hypothetical protein